MSEPSSLDNEAATIWANAIRETGLWLSPFAENVAELGRLIIPRMQQTIRAARAEALEVAAQACEARRDRTGPQSSYAVLDVNSYVSACDGCAYDIRAENIGESEERTSHE